MAALSVVQRQVDALIDDVLDDFKTDEVQFGRCTETVDLVGTPV